MTRIDKDPISYVLIQSDLITGGERTVDYFLNEFQFRGASMLPLIREGETGIVQVDVWDGAWWFKSNFTRASLSRLDLPESGRSSNLSIWDVDPKGTPIGDTYSISSFESREKKTTYLIGSRLNSMEGNDLEISCQQLAVKMDSILGRVNRHNWQVVSETKQRKCGDKR